MRKLFLLPFLLLFGGCGLAYMDVTPLKYTKAQYLQIGKKNKFLAKKGNCEFLGQRVYTIDNLRELGKQYYIETGIQYYRDLARLAFHLLAQETYDSGGNIYYFYDITDYSLMHTNLYEQFGGKIGADMYKCKCIFVDCL